MIKMVHIFVLYYKLKLKSFLKNSEFIIFYRIYILQRVVGSKKHVDEIFWNHRQSADTNLGCKLDFQHIRHGNYNLLPLLSISPPLNSNHRCSLHSYSRLRDYILDSPQACSLFCAGRRYSLHLWYKIAI